MKQFLKIFLTGCLLGTLLTGCGTDTGIPSESGTAAPEKTSQEETMTKESIILPTVYGNSAVVTEDKTEAGSVRRWQRQEEIYSGSNTN